MKTTHHSIGIVPVCRQWLLNTGRIQNNKMAQTDNLRKRIKQGHNTNRQATIRCMQINLLHSRVATNIKKVIEQDNSDIFIQEPYLHQNRMGGITKSHRNYISH